MATRRTVDLGVVGFGLVPDTRQLELSLTRLRKFGKEVERLGMDTEEVVQKQYRKFAQLERILTTLFVRVQATTERMRAAGVAAAEIDKVTNAYSRLNRTIIQNADAINRSQVARGVVGMGSIIQRGNRMAAAQEANKMVVAFRDLERAAILAIGPLSGVGARLQVMAALFESTTAKMAIFIAATTGTVVGLSLMGVAGVKATIDMQRFEAQLTASTGALQLAGDAYQHVLTLSNKLGHNVRDIIEPYAKFTTAARLSNVALADQRKIFESALIAGTAMRLNGERMGLVFLALEQMFSKGTVTMEELRRQLGDLLPGSFELSAQAMGVTGEQLSKMIRNGEVLAKDLLPLLADKWVEAFGPSAQLAAQTLQAEQQRLGTSAFEVAKAFDRATRFSDLWRGILVQTNVVLQYLAKNMGEVIGVFGALAGAAVGFAVLTFFSRLSVIIPAVVVAVQTLTKAVLALNVAMLATGVGSLVSLLARGVVVVGAAAAGYYMMRQSMDPVVDTTKELNEQTRQWLDIQERVGKTQKQVADESRRLHDEKLAALTTEVLAARFALESQLAGERKRVEELSRLANVKPSIATPFGGAIFGVVEQLVPESREITAAKARVKELEGLINEQADILARLDKLQTSTVGAGPGGGEPGTQWENWVEKIRQAVREVQGLDAQLKAAALGKTAMEQAEGMAKALEMMADQPDKKRGNITAIARELDEAGFAGKNLTDQLAALFTLIEQRKEAIREIGKAPQAIANAGEAIAKAFEKLQAERIGALFGDPENLTSAQRLEKTIVALQGHFEVLARLAGLSQDKIDFMLQAFREQWTQTDAAIQHSNWMKSLIKDLEKLNQQLGDKGEKAVAEYERRMQLALNGLITGLIPSYEEYAELVDRITDDMHRKIINRSTIFGRAIADAMRDLEQETSEILARMTMGQEIQWRDMFNSILQEALTFFYRISVIQPIMKGLFGGLYTERNQDIMTGVFEGAMRSFIGTIPTPSYGTPADMTASYLGFQGGGSFMVGGSGGPDSQLVAFRATPNERVDVLTPDQQMGGGRGGITSLRVNVRNETGVAMEASQGPITFDSEGAVVELLFSRLKRNAADRERLASFTRAPRF